MVPAGANRWKLVPGGTGWCELVLGGTGWYQAVPASQSWYWLVEPGEIGNVGNIPCSSMQDCNNANEVLEAFWKDADLHSMHAPKHGKQAGQASRTWERHT